MRHSDAVLEAVLYRSGRERNVIQGQFHAIRDTLRELLTRYDLLVEKDMKSPLGHTEKRE